MKKIFLSLIATVLSVFAYAQKDTPSIAPHATPHIRCERKELKREHYADRSQKLEMRIHRDKRELRHIRNGKQHEWKHNRMHRPMNRGNGARRHPMMDHKRN